MNEKSFSGAIDLFDLFDLKPQPRERMIAAKLPPLVEVLKALNTHLCVQGKPLQGATFLYLSAPPNQSLSLLRNGWPTR